MTSYEDKIKALGLTLPPPAPPVGSYRPAVVFGSLAFLSGQLPKRADGTLIKGRLGQGMSLDEAKEAARTAAVNVLSLIRHEIGFDRFERILRVVGYVQSAPDFTEHSAVVNGASDLFLEVFGEKGVHARSSLGMASLPLGAAVEIEVTLALKGNPKP